MSQPAGEIYIDIGARLNKLETGLKQAEQQAKKSGDEAGKGFSFSFKDKFNEQAKGVIGQFAGPMIAATLAKSAASVLRSDKALPEAILDGLKTIPFVGAFVDLGSAIYDATFGASEKAAEDLAKQEQAARDSRLQSAAARQQEAKASDERRAALMIENRKLEIEREVLDVRATGDERATAIAEARAKAAQLELEFNLASAQELDDAERKLLEERFAKKIEMLEEETRQRVEQIDAASAKEAQAAEKAAQDKQKQADKEAESIAARAQAADDAARAAEINLQYAQATAQATDEQERAAAQARDNALRGLEKEKALRGAQSQEEIDAINRRYDAEAAAAAASGSAKKAEEQAARGTSSASTALGTFVFDPYPPAQQRQVQERTARGVEELVKNSNTQQSGIF